MSWSTLTAACVGTTLSAFSANTFNQCYEYKTDALMGRTKHRPLPSGRISRSHAAAWGISTGIAGTAILAVGANPLTAALGVSTIALYAGVYTPMKQMHYSNTWVGAVVGAIPPVMGWTATGGALFAAEPALLAATLFGWQFPHFFSLAWIHRCYLPPLPCLFAFIYVLCIPDGSITPHAVHPLSSNPPRRRDYASGNHKMLPVVEPSGASTGKVVCMRCDLGCLTRLLCGD